MATKAPPAKEAPKPADKAAAKEPPKDDKAKAPAPGKDDGKAPASKEPPKDDKSKATPSAVGKDTANPVMNGAPVQGQSNPENRASVSNANPADAKQMGNFFDALDNPDQQHADAKNDDDEDEDSANLLPVPTDDPKEIQKRKN